MFKNDCQLIFNSVEEKTSSKGNPYRIANFSDPTNYQRLDFFCNNDFKLLASPGDNVTVTLEAIKRGFSVSMNVSKIETVF